MAQLGATLDAIDAGTKIMIAAHDFGIPCSTLRNHQFGTTMSRNNGNLSVLTPSKEEEHIIDIKKMVSLGYSLTPLQLCLEIAEMTQ